MLSLTLLLVNYKYMNLIPEKVKKCEDKIVKALLILLLLSATFLYYWYFVDGVYVNKVITYRNGVDPQNFQTVKSEYKRGEMVQYYTSFCKNRRATASVRWTLANHFLTFYNDSSMKELPLECFPSNDGEFIVANAEIIPSDAELGDHYFTGVITRTTPDGRHFREDIKTVHFQIVE